MTHLRTQLLAPSQPTTYFALTTSSHSPPFSPNLSSSLRPSNTSASVTILDRKRPFGIVPDCWSVDSSSDKCRRTTVTG